MTDIDGQASILSEVWEEVRQSTAGRVIAGSGYQRVLIATLSEGIRHFVVGAVDLLTARNPFAARVLVRSALEYAIAVTWLDQAGDKAVAEFEADAALRSRQLAERAAEIEMPAAATFQDAYLGVSNAELRRQSPHLQKFEAMVEDVIGKSMYVAYSVLSGTAHPSLTAATAWMDVETGMLATYPNPEDEEQSLLATLGWATGWCLPALDRAIGLTEINGTMQRLRSWFDLIEVPIVNGDVEEAAEIQE